MSQPKTTANTGSVEQWVRDLTNYDVEISRQARNEIRNHPAEAKPLLIHLIEDQHAADAHRVVAATALGTAISRDDPETKVLVAALRDKNNELRWNAMRALLGLNLDTQQILPFLAQIATDRNPMVRRTAAQFYGELGERAVEGLPVLETLSKDENKAPRDAANDAIAKVTPVTLEFADSRLTSALEDLASPDPAANERARAALTNIGPDSALELVALLDKDDASVKERGLAAEALGFTGQNGNDEVQSLVAHVHKGEAYVRCRAMTSLGQLAVDPKVLVPLCIEMLADKDASMRRRSAGNLGIIGADAKDAIASLTKAKRDDKDGKVRSAAAWALAQIEVQEP